MITSGQSPITNSSRVIELDALALGPIAPAFLLSEALKRHAAGVRIVRLSGTVLAGLYHLLLGSP